MGATTSNGLAGTPTLRIHLHVAHRRASVQAGGQYGSEGSVRQPQVEAWSIRAAWKASSTIVAAALVSTEMVS
jgi:hypothetical protein